jgi:hypothetical protein
MSALGIISIIAACFLAGSGVKTQGFLPVQMKAAGESIYFTLALPVSRLRLLAVRTSIGLAASWAVNLVAIGIAWSLYPAVRGKSSFADLCKFIAAIFVFLAVFHLLAVWLTTFLDDMWAVWGATAVWLLLLLVATRVALPHWLNIFRMGAEDSPLTTHTLPWGEMAVCIAMGTGLFLAAKRVVETREY